MSGVCCLCNVDIRHPLSHTKFRTNQLTVFLTPESSTTPEYINSQPHQPARSSTQNSKTNTLVSHQLTYLQAYQLSRLTTQQLTNSPTYQLTNSPTNNLANLPTHRRTNSSTYKLINSLTQKFKSLFLFLQ